MRSILLGFFVFGFSSMCSFAQCPAADFTPSTLCLNSRGYFTSTVSGAASYQWNFCDGSLFNLPTFTYDFASTPGAFDLKSVEENGNYFMFSANLNNNSIFRFDLGGGLNGPSVSNLGDFGGSIVQPLGVGLWSENGSKYVLAITNGGNLYLLTFGSSYSNTPMATQIPGVSLVNHRHMKILSENGNVLVLLAGGNTNSVSILNFGSSILNTPSLTTVTVPGASFLFGLDVFRDCNGAFALVSSYATSTLYMLSFGSSFLSAPTITELNVTVGSPSGLFIEKQVNSYVAFVSSDAEGIVRLTFGSDLSNSNPDKFSIGKFTNINTAFGFTCFNVANKFFCATLNFDTGNLKLLSFPPNCETTGTFKDIAAPLVQYATPGIYQVTLTAIGSGGEVFSVTKPATVQNLYAPVVNITNDYSCPGVGVTFTATETSGKTLTSLAWTIDGSNSTAPQPTHVFSSATNYNVSLNATASDGCTNIFNQTISIFNPPLANFDLPTANPFCTNQNYQFTNTSTYDNGSNPSWQWNVNGTDVSTATDLSYLFTVNSAQSITLTAAIPGCSTQMTQNINSLADGPLVTFDSMPTNEGCVGSPISFTNTTAGNIDSQSWDFGDGNSSIQPGASNSYSTVGNFLVQLTVTSGLCQNFLTKNIAIYSVPQPALSVEAPPFSCERSPAQFHGNCPFVSDSNISTWVWSFGDSANGTMQGKNPSYTYVSAGDYFVTLTAISNHQCSGSTQQTVTIHPSPIASFINSPACLNQTTQFTDTSTGDVDSYHWTIDNKLSSTQDVSYTFNATGSFPVSLVAIGRNDCRDQITKNIVVPIKPIVNFVMTDTCTRYPTSFRELNPDGEDPAKTWNWNFGASNATGAQPTYLFPSAGFYTVTMNTTRESGCVYSLSKNIIISPGPIASFSPSAFAGGAPLSVTFNNTSSADSYAWNFGDAAQTTSTVESPTFSYNSLGRYKPLLTVKNRLGCIDTLSTFIDVVIPKVDILMDGFSLTSDPSSNVSKPVVTIQNAGNIPLIDPEVIIDLGGSSRLKEKISGLIVRPGKSVAQTLDLQIIPQILQYVCAEIDVPDDMNALNNKQCVSLSTDDVVMSPYPNPSSSGQVTLEWIGSAEENVRVTIFKSTGEITFEQTLDAVQSGLGQVVINTSSFANGLYVIQFVSSNQTKTFRLAIAN